MADATQIKSSIERAMKAMQLRPSIARTKHVGKAVLDADGLGCTFSYGDQEIRLDVPAAVGGEANAPSPGAYVRSALAGCLAIGIKMYAAIRDLPVEGIEVDLEVDADDRADFGLDGVPPGYEAFRLNVRVESSAPRARVDEVVREALAASPLLDLHRRAQDVSTQVEIVSLPAAGLRG